MYLLIECEEDNSLLIIAKEDLVSESEKIYIEGDKVKFFYSDGAFYGIVKGTSDSNSELLKMRRKLMKEKKPNKPAPAEVASKANNKRLSKTREVFSPEPPKKKKRTTTQSENKKIMKIPVTPAKSATVTAVSSDSEDISSEEEDMTLSDNLETEVSVENQGIEEVVGPPTPTELNNVTPIENDDVTLTENNNMTRTEDDNVTPIINPNANDDGLDQTQLLGKSFQCKGGMVPLISGVYCKRQIYNNALARAKAGTSLVRNLLEGIFNQETLAKCTLTGQGSRKNKPVQNDDRVAMNPVVRERIIDFIENEIRLHPQWPKHTRNDIKNAIVTKLVEIKAELKKNKDMAKK